MRLEVGHYPTCYLELMVIHRFIAVAFVVAVSACWGAVDGSKRPLSEPDQPLDKTQTYNLRVLYAEDPRLPTLTATELEQLWEKVGALVLARFGYNVTLRVTDKKDIFAYFEEKREVFDKYPALLKSVYIDPRSERHAEQIRSAVRREVSRRPLPMVAGYFPNQKVSSVDDAVTSISALFERKLASLSAMKVADGSPFLDTSRPPVTSYVHWYILQRDTRALSRAAVAASTPIKRVAPLSQHTISNLASAIWGFGESPQSAEFPSA